MRRTPVLSARLVLALVTSGAPWSTCSDTKGTSVAEVPFTAADGSTTAVADFEGAPLVVNMWATNCVPCVKEMPALDEVATEMVGWLQIIGVNVFDTPQNAAAFAADLGVSYPQFTDPDGRLSTALAVTGLLRHRVLFDADGKLVDVHQGAYTADELRAAIEQHLPASCRKEPHRDHSPTHRRIATGALLFVAAATPPRRPSAATSSIRLPPSALQPPRSLQRRRRLHRSRPPMGACSSSVSWVAPAALDVCPTTLAEVKKAFSSWATPPTRSTSRWPPSTRTATPARSSPATYRASSSPAHVAQ